MESESSVKSLKELGANEDDSICVDEVQNISDFYLNLSTKLEIFDPMDRDIPQDDN